jgi:DNA-binding SARP family transcriptional activator
LLLYLKALFIFKLREKTGVEFMIPLLKSKLMIPEIPGKALYSQRIKNLDIINKRITVITAPAGFGKTTSVLLSLKNKRDNVRWYRLEKEDGFLPIFYAHLIETLSGGHKKESLECYRTLNSIQDIQNEYPLLNAQICQDLFSAIDSNNGTSERFFLVLDNFHAVLDNPAIVKSLQYFTFNFPPNVSIIVTSRVETGILSGKLAISPDAKAICAEDLRFTKEDADKLIQSTYKLSFKSEELEKIYAYSEGWAAGLYMICHSSHPLTAYNPGPASPVQSSQDRFTRFFHEFLCELEEDRRIQLAKISILSDFSELELKEIFQFDQPEALIKWLEKSNLYIQKTMTRPIRYRFHSLFREQLLNTLQDCFTEDQIKNLYITAAAYYQNESLHDKAISLLVHIGCVREAAAIAQDACTGAFNTGRTPLLAGIIGQFSDSVIESNPYLLFSKGVVLVNIDHRQCYECGRTSLIMFKRTKDMSYLMNAFALILAVAFETCDFSYLKSVAGFLPKLRIALAGGPALKKLVLSMILSTVANEKLKRGTMLYQLFSEMEIPDPVWNYCFLSIRSLLLYRTGRLRESAENLDRVLRHPVGLSNDQLRITGIVGCHLGACLMRDENRIKALMAEMSALGEKYDSDFARGYTYQMAAFIHYQNRNVSEATGSLEKACFDFKKSHSPHLGSICRITQCLWDVNPSSAGERLQKAEAELGNIKAADIGHGYYELCQGMTGAIAKQAGDYVRAEALLLKALSISQKKGAHQSSCGILLQLADLYRLRRNPKREQYYLKRWVQESKSKDYLFFWEMDYPTFVSVCARAAEKQLCMDYIGKVIRLYFGLDKAKLFFDDPAGVSSDPLGFIQASNTPDKELRMVHFQLFGSFKMTIEGKEITEKELKTRKISGILKYILVHADKPVSRETLAAIFWPESDAKAAYASLRVALYELRKILARLDLSFEGENALIIESKTGFEIAADNVIQTDIQEFTALYQRYKKGELSPSEIEAALLRMNGLYTGDFLEDSLYDDWISLMREQYKSIFVETSYALSLLLMKKATFHEAEIVLNKHMTIDPFDEKACALLLYIYEKTDQHLRGNSFKRQFEKRFKQEFGEKANLKFFE